MVGIKLMKLLAKDAHYPPLSSCDSSCKKTWAEDRIDLWSVAFFRCCNNVLIRSNNISRSIASNNFISSGSKYNQSCSCEIAEEGGRHTCALLRGFSFFAIKAPFIISCKRLLLFVVVECPWSDESYKRIVMPQISISFFGGVMLSFQRKKFPPSRGCSSSSN